MKFMIIDDNENMRKIIWQTVCSEEDVVAEYKDGSEALTAFSNHKPDYVLMDIQMKTMDGLTTTKRILAEFPDARVIIITDYDKPAFRQAAVKAGALAFFSKENLFEVKNFIKLDRREFQQNKISAQG